MQIEYTDPPRLSVLFYSALALEKEREEIVLCPFLFLWSASCGRALVVVAGEILPRKKALVYPGHTHPALPQCRLRATFATLKEGKREFLDERGREWIGL